MKRESIRLRGLHGVMTDAVQALREAQQDAFERGDFAKSSRYAGAYGQLEGAADPLLEIAATEEAAARGERCKGCDQVLGERHTPVCPFNRAGNKRVDRVQVKIEPV